MQHWEYKIVLGTGKKVEKEINELARIGWEAVNISVTVGGAACLMRRSIGASAEPQP